MLVDSMTNNTKYNTQYTTQYTTNWTSLHPTPTSDPLEKLNLPFVHRLNQQYYYPKISTGFARTPPLPPLPPKKKLNENFHWFSGFNYRELQVYAQYSIKTR